VNKIENINKLQELYDEVEKLTGTVRFDKTNSQHFMAILLHSSIVELASSCIVLLETERYTAVSVLVRSILEAFVDLVNVIKDPNYHNVIHANFLKKKGEYFESIIKWNANNPDAQITVPPLNFDQELRESKDELKKLKILGFEPNSIKKRFEVAGMTHQYIKRYAELCHASHNSLSILEARHCEEAQGDDFSITLFKKIPDREVGFYTLDIAEYLTKSMAEIWTFRGSKGGNTAMERIRSLFKSLIYD
jgi:hypothetical protein